MWWNLGRKLLLKEIKQLDCVLLVCVPLLCMLPLAVLELLVLSMLSPFSSSFSCPF